MTELDFEDELINQVLAAKPKKPYYAQFHEGALLRLIGREALDEALRSGRASYISAEWIQIRSA